MPDSPGQELWISLAGPLVSLTIAAALFLFTWAARMPTALSQVTLFPFWNDLSSFLSQLMLANVVLAVFNLLPAFPMDGGRIFRSLPASRMDYAKSTRLAANVGQGLAVCFALLGLLTNPLLLLIAFFVDRRWSGSHHGRSEIHIGRSASYAGNLLRTSIRCPHQTHWEKWPILCFTELSRIFLSLTRAIFAGF